MLARLLGKVELNVENPQVKAVAGRGLPGNAAELTLCEVRAVDRWVRLDVDALHARYRSGPILVWHGSIFFIRVWELPPELVGRRGKREAQTAERADGAMLVSPGRRILADNSAKVRIDVDEAAQIIAVEVACYLHE